MQSEAKRARAATIQDMAIAGAVAATAAAEGVAPDKVQEMIQQKLEEMGISGAETTEDAFAEFLIDNTADMKELKSRCDALEARATITEAIVYEISNDLYKNTVRITPKPRVKGATFSEKAWELDKELQKDPNVQTVKHGFGYVDVLHKDFSSPRQKSDKITQTINKLKMERVLGAIPPYSPEGNIMRGATRSIFGAICSVIEYNKEDVDNKLDAAYKPKTKAPLVEAEKPKFSMSNPAGVTFLTGELDRIMMIATIEIENKIAFKDVEIEAAHVISELKKRWNFLYKCTVSVKARTSGGLQVAPVYKELRKEDRRKQLY